VHDHGVTFERWKSKIFRLRAVLTVLEHSLLPTYKRCQISIKNRKMNPIKILTFSTLYPNEIQPSHGIFVENRLRNLIASGGVQSVVVAPVPYFPSRSPLFGRWSKASRVPRQETRHGLTIHHPRYPVIPRIGTILAPVLLALGSLPSLRNLQHVGFDFDLIDAHYVYPDGVAAVWLGWLLSKPVVVTARGTDVNLIPQMKIPRRLICHALGRASAIIAVSEALKQAIIDLDFCSEQVSVLRNGVDLTKFLPHARDEIRHQLQLDRPTLISVGHLIERKGHDIVIRALPELPDHCLLIVGEGPQRANLQRLVASLGLGSRVRFLGAIAHDEMARYYSAADVLVLASSREGWPNVLLESMACGTPVVASNIWGNPEIVRSPECGLLMSERSSEAAAQAIRSLFANMPQRAATRKYAERFSWDETSHGQVVLFTRILKEVTERTVTAL
jgi:teichuronic acid biosynthesis glycosyltransferase TuaC